MASKQKVEDIVSGALFDFMGYLTIREKQLKLSATDEAGPAVEAIQEFLALRNVNSSNAMVGTWDQMHRFRYKKKKNK